MTDLTNLARAMTVRALSSQADETTRGAALAVLRGDAFTGTYDSDLDIDAARAMHQRIMSVSVSDMPATGDLLAILLETAAQRGGGISWSMVWQSIGVPPNTGRDMLSGRSRCTWPVWFTLRHAAFGA